MDRERTKMRWVKPVVVVMMMIAAVAGDDADNMRNCMDTLNQTKKIRQTTKQAA